MTTFIKGDKVFVSETAVWGWSASPAESLRGQVAYVHRADEDGDGDIMVSLTNNQFDTRYVRATDVSIAEGERVTVLTDHFSGGGNGTVIDGRDSCGDYWVELDENETRAYVSDDNLDYLRQDEQPEATESAPPKINVGDKVRVTNKGVDPDKVGYHPVWVQVVKTVTDERVETTDGHGFWLNERNFEVLEAAPKPELPTKQGSIILATVGDETNVPLSFIGVSWHRVDKYGTVMPSRITDWVEAEVKPKA